MGRLDSYRAKRDFAVTPEPPPGRARPRPGAPPTFMIHKHDATRLHYDLRLEIEGALASWAVPKGPSFDPKERRLAVQTEDHPLEYGAFEGRIPDGEYGAGDSIIWDRGTYETVPAGQAVAMRKKGHIVFELRGQKLHGRWHLVRTRGEAGRPQWLLFKARDENARAGYDVVAERPESVVSGKRLTRGPQRAGFRRGPHPEPIELLIGVWPPMAATLASQAAKPVAATADEHVFEVKYDGYRALAGISGGRVALQSRNGLDLAARFPAVVGALAGLGPVEAVLDGELVVPKSSSHEPGALERYVVFDLLWLDGQDLRGRPLEERRDLLEGVLGPGWTRRGRSELDARLGLAERLAPGPVADALAEAKRRGLEGMVAKRRGSPYRGGRSRDWIAFEVLAPRSRRRAKSG